jgi:DNA-binding NarL/FixJ family response regulator
MRVLMSEYLKLQEDIVLCGAAPNGKSALRQLNRQPTDIVLLNLSITQHEDIEFLNALQEVSLSIRPQVIVKSPTVSRCFERELLARGARLVLPVDCCSDLVVSCIRSLCDESALTLCTNWRGRVRELVDSLRDSSRASGFSYMVQALILLLERDDTTMRMDEIYYALSEANKTSYSAVESAMRKAVRSIFERNNAALQTILRDTPYAQNTHMANGEFLAVLTRYLSAQVYRNDVEIRKYA